MAEMMCQCLCGGDMAQVGWCCELEALLAEDPQGGPCGGNHSSSSVQGSLEVLLVFCRGGIRRRQAGKEMAQHPEGAEPAVRDICQCLGSLVASVYTKMKPMPVDGNLSSLQLLALEVLVVSSAASAMSCEQPHPACTQCYFCAAAANPSTATLIHPVCSQLCDPTTGHILPAQTHPSQGSVTILCATCSHRQC